ncbi:hypothetical protein ElyMa_003678200 [Elysia marginata]|uniref:Uncharacterized protein n=1 Tax=Elysia marginata TaxID=1093978 RepID=A0AAV4F075_9GAST|nr:hypothetical protein ElyMa_003678200 [Elysia marginata]
MVVVVVAVVVVVGAVVVVLKKENESRQQENLRSSFSKTIGVSDPADAQPENIETDVNERLVSHKSSSRLSTSV